MAYYGQSSHGVAHPQPRKPLPTVRPKTFAATARPMLQKGVSLEANQPSLLASNIPHKTQTDAKPAIPLPKPHPRSKAFGSTSKPPMPLPPNPGQSNQEQQPSTEDLETEATRPASVHPVVSQTPILEKPHTLSDPMTLQQLVNDYSDQFPLPIKVIQGYEGKTSQLSLSNFDIYNVHFVQHRQVVCIQDSTGNTYSVPLNSSAQFGIIYKPVETKSANDSKTDPLRNPPSFQKVSDILALGNRLPTVVCVTKSYQGSDETSSVRENEVLIIVGAHKSKIRGRKGLWVLSLSKREHKCLPLDCSGHFSTDPFLVRMHLPEIISCISNPFPCQAILFLSQDFESCSQHISDSLLTGSVWLIEPKVETSLIASAVVNPVEGREPKELTELPHLDIPLDDCLAGVEVAVIDMDDNDEREHLYETTRHVLETLDLSKLTSCKETGSEVSYSTQSVLYSVHQQGRARYGIEVDIPPAVFQHTKLPVQLPPQTSDNFMSLMEEHTILDPMKSNNTYESVCYAEGELNSSFSSSSDELEDEQSAPEHTYDSVKVANPNDPSNVSSFNHDQRYDEASSQPQRAAPGNLRGHGGQSCDKEAPRPAPYLLVHTNSCLPPNMESTSPFAWNGAETEFEALTLAVNKLTEQVQSLESQLKSFMEPSVTRETSATLDRNREAGNVSHLKSLNCQQIQELLDKMNLSQYKQMFAAEQINGDILSCLTEADLQEDLGMTKRVHRLRLIRVIHGQDSV